MRRAIRRGEEITVDGKRVFVVEARRQIANCHVESTFNKVGFSGGSYRKDHCTYKEVVAMNVQLPMRGGGAKRENSETNRSIDNEAYLCIAPTPSENIVKALGKSCRRNGVCEMVKLVQKMEGQIQGRR